MRHDRMRYAQPMSVTRKNVTRARRLRRETTDVEKRLWRELRNFQVDGFKFRRQHPFGPFVADFYCPRAKLIIEVDGGQHAERTGADAARTTWFESKGCRVIRFWNNEVLGNLEGVLTTVRDNLQDR